MAAFGGLNAVNKSYVSSVSFLDQREILNRLLNVTNEEYSFLDVMELMGRSIETAVPEYHTFVNSEIYEGAVTTASSSAVTVESSIGAGSGGTAKRDFTLALASAPSTEEVRKGDLLMFPNGNVGYVKDISSANLEIKSVGSDLYSAASDLNGVKVVAFSNAAGEGSKSPSARKLTPTKQSNQVQIFKEKYVITDIQNASKIEFEFKGQPYYFLKGQHEALTRFRSDIAFAMMYGQKSDDKFTDASYGDLQDEEGNPVQTTQGLHHSIVSTSGRKITNSAALAVSDWASLTKTLNQTRAPQEYLLFTGTEGEVQIDNMLNNLTTAGFTGARFDVSGKELDLGIDKFKLYGRTYMKKYLPMIDHKQVVNFTGSAGLENFAYFVPNDKIKASGSGESLDRMRVRYMAGNGTDLKYREIMLGGLAPTPTDERSVLECHYESVQGLEVLGVEQFIAMDMYVA